MERPASSTILRVTYSADPKPLENSSRPVPETEAWTPVTSWKVLMAAAMEEVVVPEAKVLCGFLGRL